MSLLLPVSLTGCLSLAEPGPLLAYMNNKNSIFCNDVVWQKVFSESQGIM